MVFTVISYAAGLDDEQRARAADGAPPFTDVSAPYPELLRAAGWRVERVLDLSAGFGDLCARELAAFEARSERLRKLLGDAEHSQRLALRRAKLAGVREGSIVRELFVARAVA